MVDKKTVRGRVKMYRNVWGEGRVKIEAEKSKDMLIQGKMRNRVTQKA